MRTAVRPAERRSGRARQYGCTRAGPTVTGIEAGSVIFGVMLTLMVVRVPIGIAMFIVGFGGYLYLTGGNLAALLNSLKNLVFF